MATPTFTSSAAPPKVRRSGARGESTTVLSYDESVHRSPQLDAAFVSVVGRIDEVLAHAQVEHLSDAEVLSALQGVESLQRKITALQLALAATAEDRPRAQASALARKYGCRNTVELLQRTTLISARHARNRIRLGKLVTAQNGYSNGPLPARYEHVRGALSQGLLGIEAVTAITGMLDAVHRDGGVSEHLAIAERELVGAATGTAADTTNFTYRDGVSGETNVAAHADQTRTQCQVWQQFLDPDGTLPDEEAAFLKRGFRLGQTRNGLVPVTGALAPEVAALLARVFDSINSPRTDTNTNTNTNTSAAACGEQMETHGNTDGRGRPMGTTLLSETKQPERACNAIQSTNAARGTSDANMSPSDPRTPDQKRHDALAVILETIARHPKTPLLGGAPVTVLIQTTEAALAAQHSESIVPPQETARLNNHDGTMTPVSMRAVRHAACSGAVQRVAQDSTGRITRLGVPERLFNAHQRRAITLRDGGCVIPGCTVPASWCEVHHVIEYARGGPTHTDNGVLLCWYHHRSIDTNGWHVRMSNGVPETQAPSWFDADRPWRRHKPPDSILRQSPLQEAA